MPCETKIFKKDKVNLGAFVLNESQIDMLNDYKVLTPTPDQQSDICKQTADFFD